MTAALGEPAFQRFSRAAAAAAGLFSCRVFSAAGGRKCLRMVERPHGSPETEKINLKAAAAVAAASSAGWPPSCSTSARPLLPPFFKSRNMQKAQPGEQFLLFEIILKRRKRKRESQLNHNDEFGMKKILRGKSCDCRSGAPPEINLLPHYISVVSDSQGFFCFFKHSGRTRTGCLRGRFIFTWPAFVTINTRAGVSSQMMTNVYAFSVFTLSVWVPTPPQPTF